MLPNQVTYRTYRIQALDICTNEKERRVPPSTDSLPCGVFKKIPTVHQLSLPKLYMLLIYAHDNCLYWIENKLVLYLFIILCFLASLTSPRRGGCPPTLTLFHVGCLKSFPYYINCLCPIQICY